MKTLDEVIKYARNYSQVDGIMHGGKLTKTAEALDKLCDAVQSFQDRMNSVYDERNQLVAALSKIFPAVISHQTDNPEPGWENIIYISIPAPGGRQKQVSWHIHENDLPMFSHLEFVQVDWDGHTTEEKYKRLKEMPYLANLIAKTI